MVSWFLFVTPTLGHESDVWVFASSFRLATFVYQFKASVQIEFRLSRLIELNFIYPESDLHHDSITLRPI